VVGANAPVTGLDTNALVLSIGANDTPGQLWPGQIFYVKGVSDGATFVEVDFTDQTPGASTITAETGQTVTMNGNAAIVPDGQLRIHDSTPTYLDLPGAAADDTSLTTTMANAADKVTAVVRFMADDTTPASNQYIIGGNASECAIGIRTSGQLRARIRNGAETLINSDLGSISGVVSGSQTAWVKVEWDLVADDASAWYSLDDTNDPDAVAWTALDQNEALTGGDNAAHAPTTFYIGSTASTTEFAGAILYHRLTWDGTVEIDADFTDLAPGVTSFTEDSTNAATVTLNGNAAIAGGSNKWDVNRATSGYTTTLVGDNGPMFVLDGTNDYLEIADNSALDFDPTVTDSTIVLVHRAHNLGTGTLIAKRNGQANTDDGWSIYTDASGIPTAEVADGTNEASDTGAAPVASALVTTGFLWDSQTADEIEATQNGVGTGSASDTSSVGTGITNTNTVRIGTESDGGVPWDGEFIAAALWQRLLTDAEILEASQRMAGTYTQTEPDLRLQIAFGDSPLTAAPTWTDTSDYIRQFNIRRGRNNETTTPTAGTLTITLDNNDARFTPWNTSSPYNPNILPMTPIRLTATWQATPYPLFTGFIESWPVTRPGGNDTIAELTAVDGMKLLAYHQTATAQVEELSGTRVGNWLDEASWPTAWRYLDTGATSSIAHTPQCEAVLALCHDTAKAEGGLFLIGPDGYAIFQDQNYRDTLTPATYGDNQTTELPMSDLELSYDDSHIWNEVTVVTTDGSSVSVSDATSITAYGKRTLKQFDVHAVDGTAATALANLLLTRYKDPQVRVEQILINPHADNRIWPRVLIDDVSKLLVVNRRPDAGGPLSQTVYVEGIRIDATPKRWRVIYQLSPYS
jgi:hypothetical protein